MIQRPWGEIAELVSWQFLRIPGESGIYIQLFPWFHSGARDKHECSRRAFVGNNLGFHIWLFPTFLHGSACHNIGEKPCMKVKIVHIEGLSAAFMLAPGPGVELVQRIGRKFRLNSQAEETALTRSSECSSSWKMHSGASADSALQLCVTFKMVWHISICSLPFEKNIYLTRKIGS